MATRTVVLLLVIVGLSAGAAAFAFANASAQTPTQPTTSNLNNYNGQWPGLRGAGPLGSDPSSRSFTTFRAGSMVANVSVTGFNIVDSNHLTVSLAYHGTGTTPAVTIVVVTPGLSGSNTVTAGWTSPTTVSVDLVGSGSLTSGSACIRVLVAPLTGA